MTEKRKSHGGSLVLGGVLILLGILFLVDDYLGIDLGHFGWPFFVILPGVAIYLVSLALPGKSGKVLSAVGSIITMVGLILFFQNSFGHFESWAYTWALVAPTSMGLGWIGRGLIRRDGELTRQGTRLTGLGVVLFLAFGVFFELVVGLGGYRLPWAGNVWPVLLILLGLFLLARNYWGGMRNKAS